jgi:3-oxoadipyl-CoA thiolase
MDAVIYAALRTPVGAAAKSLASVRADDLAGHIIKAVVARSGVSPGAFDDVVFGCSNQSGEDNRNVARMALLLAGLPTTVPGQTVNRLCGSGLQAAASAAQAAKAGEGELFIAGGVESMTRAPYVQLKPDSAFSRTPPVIADTTVGWRFINRAMNPEWTIPLGETAEVVAREYGITREAQDAFAVESQKRAAAAIESGVFADELSPVPVPAGKGEATLFERDEHGRPDTTVEKLAKLSPAFVKGGTVTAGNASGINDGAAALVIGTSQAGARHGLKPLAKVLGTVVVGVDPQCMGIGPVPAIRKLLARFNLTAADIGHIELNEAFAAQALACVNELGLDPARVNPYGGAIALGHPLGATGAKLLVTLTHSLRRNGHRYGIVSMCIGVGQGIAMLVEQAE